VQACASGRWGNATLLRRERGTVIRDAGELEGGCRRQSKEGGDGGGRRRGGGVNQEGGKKRAATTEGGEEQRDERGAVETMFWFCVQVGHRSPEELSST